VGPTVAAWQCRTAGHARPGEPPPLCPLGASTIPSHGCSHEEEEGLVHNKNILQNYRLILSFFDGHDFFVLTLFSADFMFM
jgi:hypothetical protein